MKDHPLWLAILDLEKAKRSNAHPRVIRRLAYIRDQEAIKFNDIVAKVGGIEGIIAGINSNPLNQFK